MGVGREGTALLGAASRVAVGVPGGCEGGKQDRRAVEEWLALRRASMVESHPSQSCLWDRAQSWNYWVGWGHRPGFGVGREGRASQGKRRPSVSSRVICP